jgi:hypothetical protein
VCDEDSEGYAELRGYAVAWIANKDNKPLPKSAQRRFHKSVPKWLRSAIDAGMVKTDQKEVYIVYSDEYQKAVKVELSDRSKLKSPRGIHL